MYVFELISREKKVKCADLGPRSSNIDVLVTDKIFVKCSPRDLFIYLQRLKIDVNALVFVFLFFVVVVIVWLKTSTVINTFEEWLVDLVACMLPF